MDSDGGNLQILASVEGKPPSTPLITKSDPSWSPDGIKIAYTVHDTGINNIDIWVMNVDGTEITPLIADNNQNYWSPDWRPNGESLIFVSERSTSSGGFKILVNDLYMADADGSNIQLFNSNATGNNTDPRWTSDVSVAFTSDRDGNEEIYFFALFGDIALTSDGNNPNRWPSGSPDNSRVVFARETFSKFGAPETYQIMSVSTNADNPDEIFIPINSYNDVDPHWSPME